MALRRGLKRLLDLPEDLRLADDDRIEPGGHPEQMASGLVVLAGEQVRHEHIVRDLVVIGEKADDVLAGPFRIGARDVDLGPVAGRQHHRLRRREPRRQRFDGGADVAAGEVQPLAQVDRRGPVTDAYQEEMHVNAHAQCTMRNGRAQRRRRASPH